MRFEKVSFGLVLRAGRERRGISLARLSRETNVRPEIWEALEENDFSRWPKRLYARNLIREYAQRVDLDAEELVNEFCRLFPDGDRRAESLLAEQAAIIGHKLDWRDEAEAPAREHRRRAGDRIAETPPSRGRMRQALAAMAAGVLEIMAALADAKWTVTAAGVQLWRQSRRRGVRPAD